MIAVTVNGGQELMKPILFDKAVFAYDSLIVEYGFSPKKMNWMQDKMKAMGYSEEKIYGVFIMLHRRKERNKRIGLPGSDFRDPTKVLDYYREDDSGDIMRSIIKEHALWRDGIKALGSSFDA
jgi:hypothetical protein